MSTPKANGEFGTVTTSGDRAWLNGLEEKARMAEAGRRGGENNPRTLSDETRAAIAQDIKDRLTNTAIQVKYGVSLTTISRIRRESGIPGNGRKPAYITRAQQIAITERMLHINTLPIAERRGAQLRLAAAIRNGESVEDVA